MAKIVETLVIKPGTPHASPVECHGIPGNRDFYFSGKLYFFFYVILILTIHNEGI